MTDVRRITPDPEVLGKRDRFDALYLSDPDSCCDIRKVQPLAQALLPFDAVISGRKRFQASSRKNLALFELDDVGQIRINPLARWDSEMLREYALGNFGNFLHAIARDPAMVIYLDNASNRKGQPNENFAREVMELFTMGEGHYSERDIKEAARAFTGWSIDGEKGEFLFRPVAHDDGEKWMLGRSGNFDGDAVLDILLAQPQTAEFIVRKLWREFVALDPDAAEVKRVANAFRDSRYDIRVALRVLLNSDAFYAPKNRAALVKSPVDLVVGTLRQFQFTTNDVQPFALTLAQLGQNLFAPPNVKGWPGGEAWINSTSLLARKQFLDRLFNASDGRPAMTQAAPPVVSMVNQAVQGAPVNAMRQRLMRAMAEIQFDSQTWLQKVGNDPAQLQRMVLAMAPQHPLPAGVSGLDAIRRLTQDPVYQLK